jgi:hypothetical protein
MFAATLGILEFQFRRVRIHGHTLTLGIRETLRLELRQRERLGTPVLCSPSLRRNRRGSQVSRMMFSRPYRYPRGFAARRPLNHDVRHCNTRCYVGEPSRVGGIPHRCKYGRGHACTTPPQSDGARRPR